MRIRNHGKKKGNYKEQKKGKNGFRETKKGWRNKMSWTKGKFVRQERKKRSPPISQEIPKAVEECPEAVAVWWAHRWSASRPRMAGARRRRQCRRPPTRQCRAGSVDLPVP
jgi:hypothetical protein